jgi:hypothetical protein
MLTLLSLLQQFAQTQRRLSIHVIHMDLRLVSPLRSLDGLGKRHALARAAAVVQGEIRTITPACAPWPESA